jgi:hypothetical protein
MATARPLDPAVARIVEALADLMVDRDIARMRSATPAAPIRATAN